MNGSSSTLASKTDFPITTGTAYTVRLELSGDSLKMYVNDVLQLNAHDNNLTAGGIGLVAYKTAAKFDNINVSDITTGTPTSTPTVAPTIAPTVAPTATPTASATPLRQ